jgi:inhibitor of cysteine peptidase
VLGAAGCSGTPKAALELTDGDAGSTQALAVGQQLKVTLEANPTTGYQWALDGELPAQLEQKGAPVYSAESGAIGAGGTEVWTFVGKAAGDGELKLKYWRSFESTVPPVKSFAVNVGVK